MIAAKQVKIQPFFRLEKNGPVKNRQIEVDEEQTFPKKGLSPKSVTHASPHFKHTSVYCND